MKKFLLIIVLILAIAVLLACLAFLGYYGYKDCWFGHAYNEDGVCTRCWKHKPEEKPDDKPSDEKPDTSPTMLLLDTESIVVTDFDEDGEPRTQRINAMLNNGGDNETIVWTSDNPDVATVDDLGLVTIIGVGEATITATCGELTATCAVEVSAEVVTDNQGGEQQ